MFRRRSALGVCALLLIAAPLAAQQGRAVTPRDTSVTPPMVVTTSGPADPVLLDAPVRRAEYRVGPGDGIEIAFFGGINRQYSLEVTPEGTLVIPTVGVVDVLGLTLDEAQAKVRAAVFRYYQGVDVHLTLSAVRRFKVFVVGDVPLQGVRMASSVTRVSEVVPEARWEELPEQDSTRLSTRSSEADPSIIRRNILLRRVSGDSVVVDLARFRQLGDLNANPTLREGDVLVVPAVDRTVQVLGMVGYPGTYEFRPGETLAQLLSVATGAQGFPSRAADSVRIARFTPAGGREFLTLSLAAVLGAEGRSFTLQPFDAVYVPAVANYRQQTTVTLRGRVARPGAYPVRSDTTTLRELIEMAGGLTPSASLVGASLRRDPAGLRNQALERLSEVPEELLTSEEERILRIHAQGDERAVVVDFQRLLAEDRSVFEQTLRAGDVVDIPQRRDEVLVLGAVTRPGLVQHTPGLEFAQLIALVGGFTGRADRSDIVVLRARTGARVDLDEVESIDPGDAVIVPYREPVSVSQVLQTTQTVAAILSTLILTYLAVFR